MGHASFLIWFTGLSGAGKSSIANQLEMSLFEKGLKTYLLDGDNLRHGLNQDLGFSEKDRSENIRRVGEVGRLMVDAGLITLASFISPIAKDRAHVRSLFGKNQFIEVYVKCPLEICEKRDPKGLYKKARQKEITLMTGIDSVYEEPKDPDLVLETDHQSILESVSLVLLLINHRGLLKTEKSGYEVEAQPS